jgi:hypothetical protein
MNTAMGIIGIAVCLVPMTMIVRVIITRGRHLLD